ncbi:MAG TPA: carboxymuconolactone decarboxylase family protein [Acidimicrobiales bacterium]|nr:carboxymuconolactone decarboxylase family protein [Acidimicrobiales bacterium]
MQARMSSPAVRLPEVRDGLQAAGQAAGRAAAAAGIPRSTLELVNVRASQINGCAVCLDMHTLGARRAGVSDQQFATVAAWRETPYFTEAERAALALAEAGTRLADRSEPVSDEVWELAAKHYDEAGLAALVSAIGVINAWNRLNVITAQVTGEWTAKWVE